MKEKKSKEEIRESAGQFYYESIGMISIIISIVILCKLGKLGFYLSLFFKILFGDWFLLFVLFIGVYGIYLILNHHQFNFKNQRFIGYIFIAFSMLVLSHFTIHKYIIKTQGNYITNTWKFYRSLLNGDNDTYLGGGIIGALFFYISYSLFSYIGVILVCLIIFVLGFTLIINKPIKEIGTSIKSFLKKLKSINANFNNFFKYEVGKKSEVQTIYTIKKNLTLKYFDEYKNVVYDISQDKITEDNKNIIISILNSMNYNYKLQTFVTSYSCSLLSFYVFKELDCEAIGRKIALMIEESIYVSKLNNLLNIEINNKNNKILSIRELLSKQAILYNNYFIPIGINLKNQLEEIDFSKDCNMLIIGDFNTGIKNFVSCIIISCIIKLGTDLISFNLHDEINDFNNYHYLFKNVDNQDIKDYLSKIIILIDDRINEININNYKNIDEYNNECLSLRKKKWTREIYTIVLDDYNNQYDYQYIDDKIMYINQVGRSVGIYTMFISRYPRKVSSVLFSIYKYKFVFNNGSEISKLIEINHSKVLLGKGECLYYRDSNIKRIQTSKISLEEIDKIKKSC